MEDIISTKDISQEKYFWLYFLSVNYSNMSYDDESQDNLSDYIYENFEESLFEKAYDWVNNFTKHYPEVFKEADGYLENPRKLIVDLNENNSLTIEFHPGDTYFFMNNKVLATLNHESKL
jgi:hypothetical protein